MSPNTDEITVRSTLLDGTVLHGRFKIKLRLTTRDSFRLDEVRRSLLGEKSDMANENINGLASVLAKIAVHVIESPSWWKDSNNGLDLEEQGPVMDVFEAVLKAEKDHADSLRKKSEEAKKILEPELAK